ncbi:hypothetical protein C7U92_04945 [Bradyrhizobium sp. WBOS7]|uniref:Uncharacterized protein n=1 Tax=Bradyrhizobium betae TaxID=244734 RepID=A0AAE9NH27_9BRAD|nr:hypothetical protein [Bradyrhizobium sp. WBOS2]MDD1568963.1 hypothetical protein [Bradyrhizobium sp. WBOS1]MDD1576082.1 hypothetical protein [Bradyrhizobium sp. WBOS7]MDD1603347.1 hypothetical protein [Bradyrhizobium sp. WBOS16]UUO39215.1 hypothetical protein DCK84_26555 [Bradyrhizobium sp. WBOS01]UUO45387.1 hypothetical protein DCM75_26525 [Bradyrhizobium sp. WBOS02]UUO57427.1 hypothetical protein DCM79_16120 [Bradyrhizobium sp. WBOS07]UUO69844.1 hypothetical protein DCM83_26230 [Bradyrh
MRLAAMALPLLMIAPAFWNGYPLLQWDTGGYLARWYEGYLVPSRSTVFGLYLHYGESFGFWTNLAVQSLATLWLLQLTLRVLSTMQTFRFVAISLCLIVATALPWLASMLLTDIFAGLSILSLFLLVVGAGRTSTLEKISLFVFTAFAAATHSATLGVLLGLCIAGWMARPFLKQRLPLAGLAQASLTIVAGSLMLVSANYALSGKLAWTPGGYGVAFGRMMQDGIVARYLSDRCPRERYKLCPYRNELPATADEFLWGKSMFNTLGRFEGLNDEMGYIVVQSIKDYPAWQAAAALRAMGQQLLHVATGEGTDGWIPHTRGIIERYIPAQAVPMRAARQQNWQLDFTAINWLHVPVALASMLGLLALLAHALANRRLDDLTLLAATVTLALLGNAFICAVISGPHDRYGARMVWVATFVVLMAVGRRFGENGKVR